MKEYVPFDISYWLRISNNSYASASIPVITPIISLSDITLEKVVESKYSQQQTSRLSSSRPCQEKENEDLLESIIEDRRSFLANSIKQLDAFQKERIRLSSYLKYRIEYYVSYHKTLIYELDFWERGGNSMVEKRRMHLEKISVALRQEKRQEEISCWRDIVMVSKDIRILLKEYIELSIKKRVLQK